MVLLKEKRTVLAGEEEFVDALAEFWKLVRKKFGSCSLVGRLPRFRAVLAPENPDGRDPDKHPILVRGIYDDGMQAEATCTRLPSRSAGVVRERRDLGPGFTAINALKKRRGRNPGVENVRFTRAARFDVPNSLELIV